MRILIIFEPRAIHMHYAMIFDVSNRFFQEYFFTLMFCRFVMLRDSRFPNLINRIKNPEPRFKNSVHDNKMRKRAKYEFFFGGGGGNQ